MYGSPGGLEEWARQQRRARRRQLWREYGGIALLLGLWLLGGFLDSWLGY